MSEVIRIKKGLDINLKGKAKEVFAKETSLPELFSVRPDDFHGIKPKTVVKEGDQVKVGSVLFYDKANPDLKVVSPVSGEVVAVNRGERRKVLDIRVKSDGQFASEAFEKGKPASMSKEQVKEALLNAGFFAFIKQRPFDVIANPNDEPKAIFISGFDTAPLAPNYDFIMVGRDEEFQLGVDALAKISGAKVHIGINVDNASKLFKKTKGSYVEIHEFEGPHPAGNVGVQIHHVEPINKGDVVWTINAQDVAMIGKAFLSGSIDFSRSIALVGSCVKNPCYCKTVYGASVTSFFKKGDIEGDNVRYISGNPLSGTQIPADGFLGAFDAQVTVIPEGDKNNEFLGWIMPRFNKFSVNRSYFSWLLGGSKEYDIDTNMNGGERAFIMSGEYDKVFPMDIYPEFLVKAIIARDIDKMEQLGIYEVIPEDFALCEFVCTSKIETQRIVREGLDFLRKELA